MGNINNKDLNKKEETKLRKIFISLYRNEKIKQPEKYCDNKIRTSKYTL